MIGEIRGYHVLAGFVLAFGVIIAVNVTLAVSAVRTFPGLESRNVYVASQQFDATRAAQEALQWRVAAHVTDGILVLSVTEDGLPVFPQIEEALFGRATSVRDDQRLQFARVGDDLHAPVVAGPGNWNLRLRARAADGTPFAQRIIVGDGS